MGNIWKRIVAQLHKPLFAGPPSPRSKRIFARLHRPLFAGPPPRMPATPFGEIRDGAIVRVVGRALADGEPWRTPLGGLEAASVTWRVSEYSDESGRFDLLEDVDFGDVFWLEDDAGQRVRVERQGASVIGRRPLTLNGKPTAEMLAHVEAFFESRSMEAHGHFYGFDLAHIYREFVVPVGALVSVTGAAQLTPGAEGITTDGYRGAPHRVTLVPPSSKSLRIEFEE